MARKEDPIPHGIEITAGHITLDLNGYSVISDGASGIPGLASAMFDNLTDPP